MGSSEFDDLLSTTDVAGSASEDMIQAAEVKLSLRFPHEYRLFLKKYGAVMGAGFEIAGLFADDGTGPPLWRDVVQETTRFRERVEGVAWGDTLIPIADDGIDVTFFLDASSQSEARCPVVACGPGVDGLVVAGSLEEFVLKFASNKLRL